MKLLIAAVALILVATSSSTKASVLPRISTEEIQVKNVTPELEGDALIDLKKRAGFSASGSIAASIPGISVAASGSIGLGIGNDGPLNGLGMGYGNGYGGMYGNGYGGMYGNGYGGMYGNGYGYDYGDMYGVGYGGMYGVNYGGMYYK